MGDRRGRPELISNTREEQEARVIKDEYVLAIFGLD